MGADTALPSAAAAQFAVDVLLDTAVLRDTLAHALPPRGDAEAYLRETAIGMLHALAQAATPAMDATRVVGLVRAWLAGDLVEPTRRLDEAGMDESAAWPAHRQNDPLATWFGVRFDAGDGLDTLLRVASDNTSAVIARYLDGAPLRLGSDRLA
ncbi:hypothetical protein ALI22I_20255 [Saccharothrix sp. ALI-22-I]|uniref:hypothetical protein n=1 Tax=Saccharothrix sp. ALI-22-I TaxID=1933778 RepID=UPI0009CBA12A|nr:hypothetical protein [Saccharothrix sp. ALI-22-I]ONI88075.1 hypothetical protein ALI22I_20255 [Saccharothrix sp. ALI-22-I]